MQTSFAPGQRLIELTGNADDPVVDSTNVIPNYVTVDAGGKIDLRIPRNKNASGVEHDKGYVIYGLPTPRGTLSLTNIAQTLPAEAPAADGSGTSRLTALDVITGNSFQVKLDTTPVLIDGWHDVNADGDNAIVKINEGLDLNNNGTVDFRTPSKTDYGFEAFTDTNSPLYGGGSGQFAQTIDATRLPEGNNFITVRAYRHGDDSDAPRCMKISAKSSTSIV